MSFVPQVHAKIVNELFKNGLTHKPTLIHRYIIYCVSNFLDEIQSFIQTNIPAIFCI